MSRRKRPGQGCVILADPEVPREPSAWLRAAAKARLAQAAPLIGPATARGIAVVLYLTDPPAGHGNAARCRWEFTCDRCGHWCIDGEVLVPVAHMTRSGRSQVVLMIGLCEHCGIAERGAKYATRYGIRRPTATDPDLPQRDG